MHPTCRSASEALLLLFCSVSSAARNVDRISGRVTAVATLDTAIARMGGMDSLRAVRGVGLEIVTQWLRTSFDETQGDQPSYEVDSDLRDYTLDGWRNTRRVGFGPQPREIVDIVRDTVAIRRPPGVASSSGSTASTQGWTPLNVTYVQERDELFAVSPERLLLAARQAADLRPLADTMIGGAPHARVMATVRGFPVTIHFRRSTGFPAFVRFRADETDDFGLAPFGRQDVEYHYSSWQRARGGIAYPMQMDVRRVGRPYKRLTITAARFDLPEMPDSFAVSDSLRSAFLKFSRKPMVDVPFGPVRVVEERFATFNAPGAPAGAVKVGTAWVLLEAGQAPLSAERAVARITELQAGPVVAALATVPVLTNGGAAWLRSHGVRVYAALGAAPFMAAIVAGHDATGARIRIERSARWLEVGGDSLRIEPVDLVDYPNTMVVYVPSLRWMYSALASSPLQLERLMALARARGWDVERVGSMQNLLARAPGVH